jgi:superfamily I DNA and RNA helicase
MLEIIRGEVNKPGASELLITMLKERQDLEDAILYLGYPIIGTIDKYYEIDSMLISKKHGIVMFDLIESEHLNDRSDFHYEIMSNLQGKLIKYKELREKMNLLVEINMITFAPNILNLNSEDYEIDIAKNKSDINNYLDSYNWDYGDKFEPLLQSIQAITTIKSPPKRTKVKKQNSRGAILKELEDSISTLDSSQGKAVIETVNGVQRIRGLAGSGKTIVLALKVAYLHAKNPEWKIAVTFNTRSLKDQFKTLISRFVFEHTGYEPNWDNIKIIHAWGSSNSEGIYYDACKSHGAKYYDYSMAKAEAGREKAFTFVCDNLLSEVKEFKDMFNVILIDEAQDFSDKFLRLCYEILDKNKRLIFAYDELQSLNTETMKTPQEIFGKDNEGNPKVNLNNISNQAKQDIILKKCYRNSRPVLVTAHALGFGIYYNEGLIQLFDESGLWKDIGYNVTEGSLAEGTNVCLARSTDTSPEFLEEHSPIEDLIKFKNFNSKDEEYSWVAEQIKKNLEEDELEYTDIMVIHTNPITTRNEVSLLREKLYDLKIRSHLAGVNTSPDQFFLEDSITFTSIHRAKGNEAAMIYVLDGQYCYSGRELAKKRNILFTAITRSKAWVRVVGFGSDMEKLIEEFSKIKNNDFKLRFKYPTKEEREKMKIINRDISNVEKEKIDTSITNLNELIKSIENEEIYLEDLPPEIIDSLKELLKND